LESKYIVFSL
jgi:hypothetical protein